MMEDGFGVWAHERRVSDIVSHHGLPRLSLLGVTAKQAMAAQQNPPQDICPLFFVHLNLSFMLH